MLFIPTLPVEAEFTAMLTMLSNADATIAEPQPLKPKRQDWIHNERKGKGMDTETQKCLLLVPRGAAVNGWQLKMLETAKQC